METTISTSYWQTVGTSEIFNSYFLQFSDSLIILLYCKAINNNNSIALNFQGLQFSWFAGFALKGNFHDKFSWMASDCYATTAR